MSKRSRKDKDLKWFVYVLRCADKSLYCGITTDLLRRVEEHNSSSRGAKYTRSRRPVYLVGSWPCLNKGDALRAEARFKAKSKAEKEAVVSREAGRDAPDSDE